jgi:hypothetical protein
MTAGGCDPEVGWPARPDGRPGDSWVNLPAMRYPAVDGQGNPNTTQAYQTPSPRCSPRRMPPALGRYYLVSPLESLWSAEDMSTFRTRD